MVEIRSYLTVSLTAAIILAGCAEREAIEPMGEPDVRPVGQPVKSTLQQGLHIIERSFGGVERVLADPSYALLAANDPDSLEKVREVLGVVGIRPGAFLWEGLVRNEGDIKADSVYIRIRFAGGYIDSAYVEDHNVRPKETALYSVYSLGGQVDEMEVLWSGREEET
jgi:hypothetical protein